MAEAGFFRAENGTIIKMDLPLPEVMADKLIKGYLTRVNEDGSLYVEPSVEGEEPAEPAVEQPPTANAPKAVWIGYAVRVHGVRIDDAEAMTKHDLMELYGPKA